MYNQISKSIEKIITGDTILSVNLKTMKFESDIVQKVDSVIHQDMIKIVFDDLTENNNTSDHPYYVANKGWSSYKPQETMKKYNVMTKQLRAGDECLKRVNDKLVKVRIKSIREDFGEVKTYNLTRLQKNNNFLANGILVSNENAK